jgi:hypothetical protein
MQALSAFSNIALSVALLGAIKVRGVAQELRTKIVAITNWTLASIRAPYSNVDNIRIPFVDNQVYFGFHNRFSSACD